MQAIINTPDLEVILDDINNIVFNVVEPKSLAKTIWLELEEMVYDGASEAFIYDEMARKISECKDIE